MRRLAKAAAAGIAAAGLGILLAVTPVGMTLEERFGLSWLFWLRGTVAAPDDVVVVSLDRQSGERLGYSVKIREWPRTVYARLIDRLSEAGASVVVLDLIFDQQRERNPAQDAALADAIARARRVVLTEKLDQIRSNMADSDVPIMVTTAQVIQPIEPLAEAAAGLAPFPLPAGQRVAQFWTFTAAAGGRATLPVVALQQVALSASTGWLASLQRAGLEIGPALSQDARRGELMARSERLANLLRQAFRDDPGLAPRLSQQLLTAEPELRRLSEALIGAYAGPDARYLNFYGPPGHLRTIPIHDLIAESDTSIGALDLAGRAIFVGQSESENVQADRFPTVFSSADGIDLSGVEIAATAFANLLDGRLLQPAGLAPSLAALAIFGLLVGSIAGRLPSLLALPACLLIGLGYLIGVELAFSEAHLWFPIALPALVQLPCGLLLGLFVQYLAARQARRNLVQGARYYLPEQVVAGLAEAPLDPEKSSEPVYAACMVADAERFTSVAEQMAPRDLSVFLNRYFEALFAVVERHGGVITDVVGDGITAVWSAPAPDADQRARACRAALEMDRAVLDFNTRYGAPGLPIRIGIHAGMVMLGNVGGSGRFAYSVIGDSVNTAARIESLNKQLGTRVLATGAVAEDLHDLLLRPLGRFQLFGKRQAVSIFEVMGLVEEASDVRLLAVFADALADFTEQRWPQAAAKFAAVLDEHPTDGPANFYLAQCHHYQSERPLPPDPAVIRLQHK